MSDCIRIRTDSNANWSAANPVLLDGELGYDTTAKNIKAGDGTTPWLSLPYLCGPCTGSSSGGGAAGGGSSGSAGGSSVGSTPGSSAGSASGSGSGSGGLLCADYPVYDGVTGLHFFDIDLGNRTGTLGLWFSAGTVPVRFSVQWPYVAGDEDPLASTMTSGWRGDASYEEAVIGISNIDLHAPREFGPWGLSMSSHGPSNEVMVKSSLLGATRQNPGWGFFAWNRASATAESRYARIYVEAPLPSSDWACGVMCNFPATLAAGVTADVSAGSPSGAVATPVAVLPSVDAYADTWPRWERDYVGPETDVAGQYEHKFARLYAPNIDAGGAPLSVLHDWHMRAVVIVNKPLTQATYPYGGAADTTYSSNDNAAATAIRIVTLESLYHPVTGWWFHGQCRGTLVTGNTGSTTHGVIKIGNEPPRGGSLPA